MLCLTFEQVEEFSFRFMERDKQTNEKSYVYSQPKRDNPRLAKLKHSPKKATPTPRIAHTVFTRAALLLGRKETPRSPTRIVSPMGPASATRQSTRFACCPSVRYPCCHSVRYPDSFITT